MFLYIGTSKGLYKYNLKNKKLTNIFSNWHKGLFKRPSKGVFGICEDIDSNIIVAASRERLTKNNTYDKSTDLILNFYDPKNNSVIEKTIVNNVYDVHQIYYFNNKIYLTDTGKNRIQIYNTKSKKTESHINIGEIRKNLNHVNAIYVNKDKILIGLNNGNKENFKNSQIIVLGDSLKISNNMDALKKGKIINLLNIYHTHDIESIDNDFLISSSEEGNLISLNMNKTIKKLPIWTRGISKNDKYIFVGKSGVASRKLRHSRYYDGMISVLDRKNFNLVEELNIPKIGQLNEILYYDE